MARPARDIQAGPLIRAALVAASLTAIVIPAPDTDTDPPVASPDSGQTATPNPAPWHPAQASGGAWKHRALRAEKRARRAERRLRSMRRVLAARPSVREAIQLACTAYSVDCATLRRKAFCESRWNPRAYNPSGASGLFQFIPSTFRGTPYGRFSIWSPYASAFAAAWMHARGRGSAWVCR